MKGKKVNNMLIYKINEGENIALKRVLLLIVTFLTRQLHQQCVFLYLRSAPAPVFCGHLPATRQ
ncbi:hypothetical protein BA1DRAFT_00850 [Photorhabdus aegyptia]|uniref:Uncharacterized protein n=1 Tax=Photorhabdus aegyptia TaxID=2805098 RepID=A0A022PLR8_9GAMM|nr:hypothetical protein BA1DRAFT_00850 [Photorhabdus aegyptia]